MGETKEDKTIAIQYKGSEEMNEFLSRSIAKEKLWLVNVEVVAERLSKDWLSITAVKELDQHKTIVTFKRVKVIEIALDRVPIFLKNYFDEVMKVVRTGGRSVRHEGYG